MSVCSNKYFYSTNKVIKQIKQSKEGRNHLIDYLTNMGVTIDEIATNNISEYVLSRNKESYDAYVNKFQMGFSIYRSSSFLLMDVFYSSVNYHAMAVGLNTAMTMLFQHYANSSSKRIQTTNQPIIIVSDSESDRAIFFERVYCFDTVPLSLLNFINSIIGSILMGTLVVNLIHERIVHSKDLQLITNTSRKLYWLSNFLYDLILCLILSGLLTVVIRVR